MNNVLFYTINPSMCFLSKMCTLTICVHFATNDQNNQISVVFASELFPFICIKNYTEFLFVRGLLIVSCLWIAINKIRIVTFILANLNTFAEFHQTKTAFCCMVGNWNMFFDILFRWWSHSIFELIFYIKNVEQQ